MLIVPAAPEPPGLKVPELVKVWTLNPVGVVIVPPVDPAEIVCVYAWLAKAALGSVALITKL